MLNIKKIVVLLQEGYPDYVYIHTDMPSPMPRVTEQNLVLTIQCAINYGIQYVRDNFDMEPEIIQC